jgi:hypothetical protein
MTNDELARSHAFRHSDFVILSTFVILFTLLSLQAAFVSCAICVPSFLRAGFLETLWQNGNQIVPVGAWIVFYVRGPVDRSTG